MKNLSTKAAVILLTMALLIGGTVGGTVAWLSMKTESVVNTFTVGNIYIELKEHTLVNGSLSETEATANVENTYKILPGTEQPKDPFVRVKANSEACWLFVKIEEPYNKATISGREYVSYSIDKSWKTTSGLPAGVYYKQVEFTSADAVHNILEGKKVSYSSDLTKTDLDELSSNKPKLTFTAYAIQQNAAFDNAVSAWTKVSGQ